MAQKSIYLREKEVEWLEEQAEKQNRSESWIVRDVIRSAMDPEETDT